MSNQDTCKMHGRQFYLMAKLAGALVCAGCVAEKFFVAEITDQIEADYPLEMKSTRASLGLSSAVMATYPGSDPT